MKIKKRTKAFVTILGLGILENLAQLFFLGIAITRQTLMGTIVFTLILYLILNQMNIIAKE